MRNETKNVMILQKIFYEPNKIKSILLFFAEPICMAFYGVMLALRWNGIFRGLIRKGSKSLMEYSGAAIQNPSSFSDKATNSILLGIIEKFIGGRYLEMLHLSVTQYALYFAMAAFIVMAVYVCAFSIFQNKYVMGNPNPQIPIKMLSYRNYKILIPLVISAIVTRISFFLGLIFLFVASIIGIIAIFNILDMMYPGNRSNSTNACISILIAVCVKFIFKIFLIFMLFPSFLL